MLQTDCRRGNDCCMFRLEPFAAAGPFKEAVMPEDLLCCRRAP